LGRSPVGLARGHADRSIRRVLNHSFVRQGLAALGGFGSFDTVAVAPCAVTPIMGASAACVPATDRLGPQLLHLVCGETAGNGGGGS
jgi:hypothetical protein